ncbi:Vacuolar protein sorting-associated protein 13 SHR-binding domain, partial [Trinorchestia longiramus]
SVSPSIVSIDRDLAQDFERVDAVLPPVFSVKLDVQDPLEVMVSRSFLGVWETLSSSYLAAYRSTEVGGTLPPLPPYSFTNCTGYSVLIDLHHSKLQLEPGSWRSTGTREVVVETGAEVALYASPSTSSTSHRRQASLVLQQTEQRALLHFKLPSLSDTVLKVPLHRACKRYYCVRGIGEMMKQEGGVVASVEPRSTTRLITLSSCLKVSNCLKHKLEVYFMRERGNEVERIKELEPGESTHLPLKAVHTPTAELFFCVPGYYLSKDPLVWRGLQNDPQKLHPLTCVPKPPSHHAAEVMQASCEVEQILWDSSSRRALDSIEVVVEVRPKVQLQNLLPFPLVVTPPNCVDKSMVPPGAVLELSHAQLGAMYLEVELLSYYGRNWKCGRSIESVPAILDVWTFQGSPESGTYTYAGGATSTLELGVHTTSFRGTMTMALYCPFWMVNKTGLDLTYRGDVPNTYICHSRSNSNPVLFSFKSKAFFGKKKASVRAEDSDWSDKFALDAVGSNGIVTCRSRDNTGKERVFQLNVSISLSANGLTKIVVFTPFYKVVNNTQQRLLLQHHEHQRSWKVLQPGVCEGLWADGATRSVRVRYEDSDVPTAPIAYNFLHSTLFRLDDHHGGLLAK